MRFFFVCFALIFPPGLFSQIVIRNPEVSSLDSFKGKFSKVEMLHYEFHDTLPRGENKVPHDTTIYSYLPSGKKSSIEYLDNENNFNSMEKFTYDNNGKLAEDNYYEILGEGSDFFYDREGRVINANYSVPECDGSYDTMSYDATGKLIAVYRYGQVCPDGYVEHYYYDKSGNMILMETTTRDGKPHGDFFVKDSICKTYDDKGRLLKEKSFSIEYSNLKKKKYTKRKLNVNCITTYNYSDSTKSFSKSVDTPADSKIIIDQYKISDSGLLLNDLQQIDYEKTSARNEKIDSVSVEYEYDSHGFQKSSMEKMNWKTRVWKYETVYNSDGNPISCTAYFQNQKTDFYEWKYFE